jgi:hypothetical protein
VLFAVTACGGNDANTGTAGESSPASAAGQAAAPGPATAGGATAAQSEIRIGGGPFAGTHPVAGHACVVQPGTWMVSSSSPGNQGLTQFLLMLEGVQATGGSSSQVGVTAHFGDSGTVSFGSEVGEGSATATARREGRGGVVEVDGTTGDGEKVSVLIRCETLAGA